MPKLAANLTMLFGEVDFLDRFEAAADSGFRGVEFLFPYAYDAHGAEAAAARPRAGAGAAQPAGRQLGRPANAASRCLPDRDRRIQGGRRTGDRLRERRSSATRVNCLAGIPPQGVEPSAARETFVSNLRYAAPLLEGGGHQAADRADQHARRARVLSQRHPSGDRDHRGGRIGQSVAAVRHLPHADHGRPCRGDDRARLPRIAHMQLADVPGGTSREPARSTTRRC